MERLPKTTIEVGQAQQITKKKNNNYTNQSQVMQSASYVAGGTRIEHWTNWMQLTQSIKQLAGDPAGMKSVLWRRIAMAGGR